MLDDWKGTLPKCSLAQLDRDLHHEYESSCSILPHQSPQNWQSSSISILICYNPRRPRSGLVRQNWSQVALHPGPYQVILIARRRNLFRFHLASQKVEEVICLDRLSIEDRQWRSSKQKQDHVRAESCPRRYYSKTSTGPADVFDWPSTCEWDIARRGWQNNRLAMTQRSSKTFKLGSWLRIA